MNVKYFKDTDTALRDRYTFRATRNSRSREFVKAHYAVAQDRNARRCVQMVPALDS